MHKTSLMAPNAPRRYAYVYMLYIYMYIYIYIEDTFGTLSGS